jgi:hypothetical protein
MFFTYSLINGQNLVNNSRFEEYYHLPELKYDHDRYLDSAFICKYWHRIKGTTPDYYHINAKHNYFTIPFSRMGYNPVIRDSAYIGFIPFDLIGNTEIISNELLLPLEAGKKYEISFFYRYAKYISYYQLSKLEIYLSPDINNFKSINYPFSFYKDVITTNTKANVVFDSIINDGEWHIATAIYNARGGEKYLSFGIFYQNDKLFKIMNEYLMNNFVIGQNMDKYERFVKKYAKYLSFIRSNPFFNPDEIKETLVVTFETKNKIETTISKWKFPYYFIDDVSLVEIK